MDHPPPHNEAPPTLTFSRAWHVILHNEHLSPLERLVLIEVCRFWPRPYTGSNHTISHMTGISVRHVQKLLKALSTGPAKRLAQGLPRRRAFIRRGYAHRTISGRNHTYRVILPICLPGKAEIPDVFTAALT